MSEYTHNKRTAREYLKELATLFFIFFKIGAFLFGGGYAMLSLLETELIEKKKWISKEELGDIFAIAESTPGPISVNTATFIGTKRAGIIGGIVATLGVITPAFAIIAVISVILDLVIDNKWVDFLFRGIRIGVLVLILKAVLSFFKSMKKTLFSFALMAIAFVLVFFVKADVIYVILGTIAVCSVVVAFSTAYSKRKYFVLGTPEYYSARSGKALEKDEYYSKKAVSSGYVKIKSPSSRTCDGAPALRSLNSENGEAEIAKDYGIDPQQKNQTATNIPDMPNNASDENISDASADDSGEGGQK